MPHKCVAAAASAHCDSTQPCSHRQQLRNSLTLLLLLLLLLVWQHPAAAMLLTADSRASAQCVHSVHRPGSTPLNLLLPLLQLLTLFQQRQQFRPIHAVSSHCHLTLSSIQLSNNLTLLLLLLLVWQQPCSRHASHSRL
jgi:hypothetical protein